MTDTSRQIDLGGNDLIVNSLLIGATGPGQAGTTLTGAEVIVLDGVTPGTATASKAVVLDSSKGIATITSATITTLTSTAVNAATLAATTSATVTSASANALAVGLAGATNPAFVVDSSTGSQAAGLKVTGAVTGGSVAIVATDSGSNTNLTVNAKGSGTIGIGSVSTGAVTITPAATVTGALTPTGGVAAAGGFSASPRNCHSGNTSAQVSTDFTDQTPVITEVYFSEVFIPANVSVTGVSLFRGSVTSGNYKVGLANSAGVVVATSASTASSGTDAYVDVAFTAPYSAVGPATYYVLAFYDNTTVRANTHTIGRFVAGKQTGQTYATGFTTITPGTSFTTALGPVATLY